MGGGRDDQPRAGPAIPELREGPAGVWHFLYQHNSNNVPNKHVSGM